MRKSERHNVDVVDNPLIPPVRGLRLLLFSISVCCGYVRRTQGPYFIWKQPDKVWQRFQMSATGSWDREIYATRNKNVKTPIIFLLKDNYLFFQHLFLRWLEPNRFSCAFTNYHVIGVILVTTDGEVNLVGVLVESHHHDSNLSNLWSNMIIKMHSSLITTDSTTRCRVPQLD